jgi:phosphohistidine phosphatase SixA
MIRALAFLLFALCGYSEPLTVILVRHAEKAAAPADNPPLTDAGQKRARALAAMLKDVQAAAVFTTELSRTIETARPYAVSKGITPTTVPAKDVDTLVQRISTYGGKEVIAVGHTNTVPAVIRKLGGPEINITEEEYDRLFVLTVYAPGKAGLLTLRY